MLVRVSLPEPLPTGALELKPCTLLCQLDKPQGIRILGDSFNQQMQMIRHEAVRKHGAPFPLSYPQNLRQHDRYYFWFDKVTATLEGAERQEVLSESAIVHVRQALRAARPHARDSAKPMPEEWSA